MKCPAVKQCFLPDFVSFQSWVSCPSAIVLISLSALCSRPVLAFLYRSISINKARFAPLDTFFFCLYFFLLQSSLISYQSLSFYVPDGLLKQVPKY